MEGINSLSSRWAPSLGSFKRKCNTQAFTPLQAENWQADMKLYVKTCSNLQTLSVEDRRTPMKRYMSTAMWPLVEVGRGDNMAMMIKKVWKPKTV